MFNCKFCSKLASNLNSKSQHELYCKSNPLRKIKKSSMGMLGKKGTNHYTKAKNLGYNAECSPETKLKISLANIGKVWSEERKQKHSEKMKEVAANNPESYDAATLRGRTKQYIVDGVRCQGLWEVDFFKWCKNNNVLCERNQKGFKYEWDGIRTYYPDFFLPEKDLYVEVKGYTTEKDKAKWSQFVENLLIVDKDDIKEIRENTFKLI